MWSFRGPQIVNCCDLPTYCISTELFGPPLIAVSHPLGPKRKEISVDVRPLLDIWRGGKKGISRALLLVSVEGDSSETKQCIRPLILLPKLVVTSRDLRHCPPQNVKSLRALAEGRVRRDANIWSDSVLDGSNWTPADPQPPTEPLKRVSRRARSSVCQRHSMYVRFDDVGWSRWIIAPRAVQAFRCAGECPFPLGGRLSGNNHAVLMTLMRSVDHQSAPSPQCVPTSLSATSLLYFDAAGNVVLRQYEDMVAVACGCR